MRNVSTAVDFSAGGLKKLKTSIDDEHLEAASAEEVKALKPKGEAGPA